MRPSGDQKNEQWNHQLQEHTARRIEQADYRTGEEDDTGICPSVTPKHLSVHLPTYLFSHF
jgi:hypothetical protein